MRTFPSVFRAIPYFHGPGLVVLGYFLVTDRRLAHIQMLHFYFIICNWVHYKRSQESSWEGQSPTHGNLKMLRLLVIINLKRMLEKGMCLVSERDNEGINCRDNQEIYLWSSNKISGSWKAKVFSGKIPSFLVLCWHYFLSSLYFYTMKKIFSIKGFLPKKKRIIFY